MRCLTQLQLPLSGPQVLQDLKVVLLEGVDVSIQEGGGVLLSLFLLLQLLQTLLQELHLQLQ